MTSHNTPHRSLRWPGLLLGFSLGGFFDGILLHQILQWHHLLSNVDSVRDMRVQLMADGLFHALMYVVAAAGLAQLWKQRKAITGYSAGPSLWGHALVAFGGWHMIDGLVSHWITGIHRIKMDSHNPLVWDLAWFVAFGVVPVLLGWWVLRGARGSGPHPGIKAAATLGLAVLVCAPLAALPPKASDQVVVIFAPGVSAATAFRALAEADARVVWVDRAGGVWAVTMRDPGAGWQLYRKGAVLVSNSALALGCVSWSRTL